MDIFNKDFKDFIICLNKHDVEYVLVGGYAVAIRGYSRSTGDLDVYVNKTEKNYVKLRRAMAEFGFPSMAIPDSQFFSDLLDVFSFGRPPNAIDILTAMKGVLFEEAFSKATFEKVDGIEIKVIHINHLLAAKKAAGRHKDLNDIENLPPAE